MLISSSLKQVVLNMIYQHLFVRRQANAEMDKPLLEKLFGYNWELEMFPNSAGQILRDPVFNGRCTHHEPLIAIRSMLSDDIRNGLMGGDSEMQPERHYQSIKWFNALSRELCMDCIPLHRIIVAPDIINNDVP